MDEATIDCQYCGEPAVVEVRVQDLNDAAEWRTIRKIIACKRHQVALEVKLTQLRQDERIVAMRL